MKNWGSKDGYPQCVFWEHRYRYSFDRVECHMDPTINKGSTGKLLKTHKVTTTVGNEHGDIEIDKYIVFSRGPDDHLPPRTLVIPGFHNDPRPVWTLYSPHKWKAHALPQINWSTSELPEPVVFIPFIPVATSTFHSNYLFG